jgi:hypothetical protein
MRRLVIATLVSLAWVVPALAQGAPQDRTVAPQAAQATIAPQAAPESVAPQGIPDTAAPNVSQNDDAISQITQSIERRVQTRLALAGFTDIQMVPTSFIIRARNRDGKAVMMELSSDSLTGSQEPPADQDDGGSRKDPQPGQPTWAFPGATDAE